MEETVKLGASQGEVVLREDQTPPVDLNNVPPFEDFECRILGVGDVTSSFTGKATITKEDVVGLYQSYNQEVSDSYRAMVNSPAKRIKSWIKKTSIEDMLGKDIRTDHSESSVNDIVGRIKGTLKLEGDSESPELWGTIRVLGKENVIKALDSRYTRLSAYFSRAPGHVRNDPSVPPEAKLPKLHEISFVQIGAYRPARIEDDKLHHPVLLSGTEEIQLTQAPPSKVQDTKMEIIKLVSTQLDIVDKELENLKEVKEIQSELNKLASDGKILPRLVKKGTILGKILSIKDRADRKTALRLLGSMPNHLCLGGETNSLNAVQGMEMIMAADKGAIDKVNDFYEKAKEKLANASPAEKQKLAAELRSLREDVKLSMTEPTHANYVSAGSSECEYKFDGGEDEYLEGMEKLMGEGKHEEAKKYHDAYKKHRLKGKELSEEQKKEADDKEEKLSGYKEELKSVLSEVLKGSFQEMEVKLSGMSEKIASIEPLTAQHKSLVEFAEVVAKELNKKSEEK